ncbi:Regulatory protein, LysR:LysR, substrate-binding [Shewanella piezotolerans WP3]|uniref:Regulatory protein, LysR:LysR, substrate-binding n=1 Tax=Shewanella piezotolerans (strain WP3 / JCM 13877) TaxID=225849 RepID=B8CLT9_SHEPW|nr:LysR family transcriptional regulator [Shewanella piezotolerans]ACJ28863.1 Regulatory protein, LysR:LysR, substrate-binding [Shewanella piezotolerans WP3]
MRLRHIEIFHAIYTTGSITNAAQFLHVSQPSVSKVLAHAEMQLGFSLFQRQKGRLTPTSEAQMLFSEVDKVYKQIHSVRNTAENIRKSRSGSISIGVTPALGFDYLPETVAAYRKSHPDININLETIHNEDVLQALLEHRIDFALVFSPPPLAGVSQHVICNSELVLMYPTGSEHSFAATVPIQALENKELIGIWDSGPLGDILWNRINQEAISVNSNIQVQTYFIAARLVAQKMGVCVVDEYTAAGNLNDEVSMANFEPPLNFKLSALHLENKALSNVATAFLEALRKTAEKAEV